MAAALDRVLDVPQSIANGNLVERIQFSQILLGEVLILLEQLMKLSLHPKNDLIKSVQDAIKSTKGRVQKKKEKKVGKFQHSADPPTNPPRLEKKIKILCFKWAI